MRFSLVFEIENSNFPLDYRKIFLSFIKAGFEKYDPKLYSDLYDNNDNIRKPYTFSVYMNKAKFGKDEIVMDDSKIILNFSTYSDAFGIYFYNSMLKMLNVFYPAGKSNNIRLIKINLVKDKPVRQARIQVKTLSPVVVREHKKERKIDNYFIPLDEGFQQKLKDNIIQSGQEFFEFDISRDVEELRVEAIDVKDTLVLHYNNKIRASIGKFVLEGKPYLLEYLLKAGMGARRSQGFGMLEVRG